MTTAEEPPELKALNVAFVNDPHPMWVYDLKTLAFLEVNDAAVRNYGYSRQEFMKMTLLDIRPEQEIERFLRSWNHPHESTAENWFHRGKNGEAFPVSITSRELIFRGRRAELVQAKREAGDLSSDHEAADSGLQKGKAIGAAGPSQSK